jgi:formate hydrogenlyase subunit 3/multisubunit Na+/H+ antiporter MnhD subunit
MKPTADKILSITILILSIIGLITVMFSIFNDEIRYIFVHCTLLIMFTVTAILTAKNLDKN